MKDTKTIALIDDDDGPIRYYEEALQDDGYQVVRIRDFREALDFISSSHDKCDCWLIDVMMPIKDESLKINGDDAVEVTNFGLGAGLVLYDKLKKLNPVVPVILLTSITTPDLLNSIEESLMDGDRCEAKLEYTPSKLIILIKEVLKR